ncbi:unnamed protein product [Ectocarpus sp. CCAP 1310/34]|nr:unnamed protein product [Ectocarpus sp. CCAP 1310/34]
MPAGAKAHSVFHVSVGFSFGCHPQKDGSVRITVNYKRLNALVDLDGQPLPRVDDILDSLYIGKVFSIFDLNSVFHQIVCDEDTVPLTAFCTPTLLFEWLRMPQGANASLSWFVKDNLKLSPGKARVGATHANFLGHIISPASVSPDGVKGSSKLRQDNLKLSPGKARVGATHANFLGHIISPASVSPDGVKVRALTHMPPPTNVKQLRSLLGGLSYYQIFLKNLATKVRPLNSLLKQGVPFKFTPGMVKVVKSLLSEFARPPILVFADWAAVEDDSRPLRLCSDACIDGFGASLEQEQLDGSVRPIVYVSRAALLAERNWTVLDLGAGGIVWAIKRLRGYLWSTKFIISSDHKALESIGKVGEHNARVPLDKQDHPDRRASAAAIRNAGISVSADCSCAIGVFAVSGAPCIPDFAFSTGFARYFATHDVPFADVTRECGCPSR